MRNLMASFALLLFSLTICSAEVIVQCRVSSTSPIWQGQRVTVEVDALTAEGWVGIKKINLGEVDGAVVLNRNPSGITISKQINGQSYSGQRKELWLYPQRGGTVMLPAFTIDVETRTWGANAETKTQQMKIDPISFEVTAPDGAPAGVVSAKKLSASQQWSTESREGVVGDAIVRTFTLTADDLPGMLLPPLRMTEQDGVGLYQKQPVLDDQLDRGELTGKRQEVVTYVFEAPGSYRIPDHSFQWFDLTTDTLKTEVFEGCSVVISGSVIEPDAGVKRTTPWWWLIGLLGLVGCGLIGQRIYARLLKSEWMAFRRVRRSARLGDKALLNEALQWGELIEPNFRIDTFLQQYGDEEAYKQLEPFYRSVDAEEPKHGANMTQALTNARRRYLKVKKEKRREQRLLPKLNP